MMIEFYKQYEELFNDNGFNVTKDNGDDNIKDKNGSEAKDDGYEVKYNVNNENDFENLLGDDTEDEVSMDIDIPNEEMKQKEADKEKVSDKNGNESEKEKQYEADKVEKTKDMFKWKEKNGEYDEKKQFEDFSKTIKSEFKKDPEMKNMKDLEMAFFPIITHEHYYLVVFNFLKGNTFIIDNSKTKMTYDAKYKTVCELLKKLFSMHLEKVEHPRAKGVLNKKPTFLRPKWGIKKNDTDCGIFLMMHMEHYNGETAKNWNLEFPTKEE
nr:ulp1 protease family, C-terminal catalytic domain-containing protein [Tanacetum cinerariifolium]